MPIVVVVLCAACGGLGWVVWRLSSRVDWLEARLARGGRRAAVERHMGGAAYGMRVENELFRGLWHQSHAPAAEARCWRKFPTSRGTAPPDPVHFYLSLGTAGEVTHAEPDLGALEGAEVPAGFTECLGQIIRSMRFPASGEPYVTRVQVDRPRPASQPAP
jgi:hypothetical protein